MDYLKMELIDRICDDVLNNNVSLTESINKYGDSISNLNIDIEEIKENLEHESMYLYY